MHSPIEGRVQDCWWPKKLDSDCDAFGFVIDSDEGDRCKVEMQNAIAPNFKSFWTSIGQRLRKGQLTGVMGIGVNVSVSIDHSSVVKVKVGETVWAGQSVLARLTAHK